MGEEKEQPLNCEDVRREIDKCRSKGEIPNFSNKVFEEGIDLRGFDLREVIFRDARFPTHSNRGQEVGANLKGIHLEKADFARAHLERANLHCTHLEKAILWRAHLERGTLWDTHLEGANLIGTHLEGANLMNTKFSSDVNLEEVDWGNHMLDEEKPGFFDSAAASYRHLKVWYTHAGYSDIAAKFYYREKEARRKSIQNIMHILLKRHECRKLLKIIFKQDGGWTLLWLWIYRLLCGYGEKTLRIIGWTSLVILGLATAYYFWGSFTSSSFWDTLYYSAASFTALGYGKWAPQPTGWAKGMGAAEAFIGVFMMALFLITFVRKMTR